MRKNNKEKNQIKEIKGKANGCLRNIWYITEKKFKDDCENRMRLFNRMVKEVIMQRVEVWECTQPKEIRQVKGKYIKRILKINKEQD